MLVCRCTATRRCKPCLSRDYYARMKGSSAAKARLDRKFLREKRERKTPEHRARYLVRDYKNSDRYHGRENDLTVEFVRSFWSGCSYCGDADVLSMSLDRVNNSLGHLRSNVVPACTRCNLIRRDMPYEAWLLIAPGLREARERGLLGTWLQKRLRHGK